MKKLVHLIPVVLITLIQAKAQSNNVVPDNVRASNVIDGITSNVVSPGYLLYGIPEAPGGIIGDVYLNSDWKKISLKIFGQEREFNNYKCRVNLHTNQIEIEIDELVKVINADRVESFSWNEENDGGKRLYCNANKYKINNMPHSGFLEILSDGKIMLLKETRIIIKKPDFNVQLNVGSKSTRIIKEETIYFTKETELVNVRSVKNKKFYSLFEGLTSEVEEFAKEKQLRISAEEDLVSIFKYYNGEVKKKEGA
jgi:hypothetical protein